MSAPDTALADFRTAYEAMLQAAECVHAAVEAEAGLGGGAPPEIRVIQRLVAAHFGYGVKMLLAKNRTAPVVTARHSAIWLCRALTGCDLNVIGAAFGGRHHTSVSWSSASVEERMTVDLKFAAEIGALHAAAKLALKK